MNVCLTVNPLLVFTGISAVLCLSAVTLLFILFYHYVIPAAKLSHLDPAPPVSLRDDASPAAGKLSQVVIIIRPDMLKTMIHAMNAIGVTGITVTNVLGCGVQKGSLTEPKGLSLDSSLLPKVKLEIAVSLVPVDLVIDTAKQVLRTGKAGDGKLFVYDIQNVVRIRTGEEGGRALRNTAGYQKTTCSMAVTSSSSPAQSPKR